MYVSNRGHDSIAVFSADPASGVLTPVGHVRAEPIPRVIGIDPDGRYFFAGSDKTGRLSTYRIDDRGMLEPLEVHDVGTRVGWILPLKFA